MILKRGDSSEVNKYIETQGGKGSSFFPLSPNLENKNYWSIIYRILLGSGFYNNELALFCFAFFKKNNEELLPQIKRPDGKNSSLHKVVKECEGLFTLETIPE